MPPAMFYWRQGHRNSRFAGVHCKGPVVMKAFALTCALVFAAPVWANIIVNGSFETGDFTGWEQVGDTSFDFVTDEVAGGGPTDGAFHAAFGSIDPGGGGITQTLSTLGGNIYTVTFDLANLGDTPNAYGLFWDGGFEFILNDLEAFTYTTLSFDLVATGSSTEFGFVFYNAPSFYLLDNISLEQTGVIPEPASWALLIAGFGLVGSAMRRRHVMASSTGA